MINAKYSLVIVAAFAAGSFLAPPVQQAIAAVIATDVQCTGCVGNSDIASSAVSASKIASNAVTTTKLNGGSVTNAKLADSAVTTSKIAGDTIGYSDVSKSFIAQEYRDDCNCGGTGWDPNGIRKYGLIADSRITRNSVVFVSLPGLYVDGFVCWVDGVIDGSATVACTSAIFNGQGINYAIIRNPAYG